MTTTAAEPTRPDQAPTRKPREWAPRMWLGCGFSAWFGMLIRNRFAVDWPYWHIVISDSIAAVVHLFCGLAEKLVFGRRIARTEIRQPPVFIIGHWRTGTTLLHELLIQDERHTFPTTYRCMEPNHFLLTEWLWRRLFRWALPQRRPMDNMATGWDKPQEDEFALCMMNVPSPYLTIAFPNRPQQFPEYLDLRGLPPEALAYWKQKFVYLLRKLTFKDPRRLVLKSPPHTCRIPVLLELFPDARFIHIVRDPYVVFPSTVNLWKSLYRAHGLQRPRFEGLDEYVFTTFRRVHERYEEDRTLIPPGQLHELRYEDLIRDPIGQVRAAYEHLGLGDFEEARPRLEKYLASVAGYETNRYEMTPEMRAEITRRWGDIIRRLGYEKPAA